MMDKDPNQKRAMNIANQEYQEFVIKHGLRETICCIQREQGDDFSLMTEIATFTGVKDIFRVTKRKLE